MLSISETAKKSGLSSYTIRYYERIGLLPEPKRKPNGIRYYLEADIQFIRFLKSLKETGMSLEDINEIVKDGCIIEILNKTPKSSQIKPSIMKRIDILKKHLEKMERKKKELEEVISTSIKKLDIYYSIIEEDEKNK